MMTKRRADHQTDVIIVGGGPVGLGLAIDLALRGVKSHVIERSTSLHQIPKGQNLTQRTGEHFRSWGVSKAVRAASPIPAEFGNAGMVAYGTLLGQYCYDWFKRSAVNQYYFAENERLPQYELERVLRARAAELTEITLHFGGTAVTFRQDETGTEVDFETTGTERITTIRAPFAVGCDGARSKVRDCAGITQALDPHHRHMALLVFNSTELHDLLERYPGKSIFNTLNPDLDGYWQFLGRVDLDGTWFFHAPVPAGTTADNFDFRSYLHRVVGAEFAIEFQHIGFWDLRIAVAKTYQVGRIFIAGDAAHSHPPYGGYGVNNGFEDIRNLSWKLAAALAGWAGDGLLASYSQERQPVFAATSQDFIARMIFDDRAFCRDFSPDRDRAAFKAAWQERATGGNKEVTQYLPNYAGSPIVWGDAGAQSGATGQHMFKARAGHHLAPQDLASGRSLFKALGRGYALLTFNKDADVVAGFQAAANARGVALTVISDASVAARTAYGSDHILVRPDHFIAWAGDDAKGREAKLLARAIGA